MLPDPSVAPLLPAHYDERVLVWTPSGRDAGLASTIRQRLGLGTHTSASADALPSEAVRGYSERHLQRPVSDIYAAGAVTLTEDQSVIERIDSQSSAPILIFVRAWEAPLLDLRDFLVALRARIGTGCSLIVVPVGVDRQLPTHAQRDTWSRWTATLADPALYLECGA